MGWGTELAWQELRERGCRLGIVDAAPMRHLNPWSLTYDTGPEQARLNAHLAARGLEDLLDTQSEVSHWWAWQSRAPWREP